MMLFLRNGTEVFKKSLWHNLEINIIVRNDVALEAHPTALQLMTNSNFLDTKKTQGKA